MSGRDEFDSYRRVMAANTPENPRKDVDIQASLRAFDEAFKVQKPRLWPQWLRLPVLIPMAGTVAAGVFAIAFLPQSASVPTPAPVPVTEAPASAPAVTMPAPPELRLALPEEPPAASPLDAQVLAAFSGNPPQYFALPWDRGAMLALLEGERVQDGEQLLFAAGGRRLVVLARVPDRMGARGQDEGYQRFVVALAGLALLSKGQDLGSAWTQRDLLAEARIAANGMADRDAALSAIMRE